MPEYEYRAVGRNGEIIMGRRRSASNRESSGRHLAPGTTQSATTHCGEGARKSPFPKPKVVGKVKPSKELAIFTRQFSVMIDAGLPLVQCLEILASQQENKPFAKALSEVRGSVEAGSTLANGMRLFPKIFDTLYANMVEAGETGGILDAILQRLSAYIEKAVKLKRAVQSALIYPIAVLLIAGGVIFLLLWKVVPIFANLFAGLDVTLPLPTRIVIGLSNAIGVFALPMIFGGAIGVWGLKRYYATQGGRMMIDRIVLKLPLLGNLMRKIGVARFTRTLGTLITSGVPMLEAMDITARTSGNAVIEEAILKVRSAVETGRTIVDPLRETGVFPNMVVQMIGVGEQTGALDSMLGKVADFYEDEVDAAVGDLLTAMEPMIILILGVVVGGVVISMYLPLFSLIGKLAG